MWNDPSSWPPGPINQTVGLGPPQSTARCAVRERRRPQRRASSGRRIEACCRRPLESASVDRGEADVEDFSRFTDGDDVSARARPGGR